MNYDVIEGLTNEQINELYNDVIFFNSKIASWCACSNSDACDNSSNNVKRCDDVPTETNSCQMCGRTFYVCDMSVANHNGSNCDRMCRTWGYYKGC